MIDTVTLIIIIICAVLFLTTILSLLLNPFFRRVSISEDPTESDTHPRLTILVVGSDCGDNLRRNIPQIMSQQYDGGFDVVIVTGHSEDDTEDVVKDLKNRYPNIYSTFIPDSSRIMSRQKLMITLGVKASKNEWILLTDYRCHPTSELWLQSMASACEDDADIVMGYSNYDDESNDFWRFDRLQTECYLQRRAQRGKAYRTASHNLLFRKSVFMQQQGFLHNLVAARGEYDYIVNDIADKTKDNVRVVNNPESQLEEDSKDKRAWISEQLVAIHTKKHLKHGGGLILQMRTDLFFLYLSVFLQIAAVVVGCLTKNWIIAIAGAVLFILMVTCRTYMASSRVKMFAADIPAWKLYLYELRMGFHRLYYYFRYKRSDASDFLRK